MKTITERIYLVILLFFPSLSFASGNEIVPFLGVELFILTVFVVLQLQLKLT
jgi:hypothetical protein